MKKYRIVREQLRNGSVAFIVQSKGWFKWHSIASFSCSKDHDEEEYLKQVKDYVRSLECPHDTVVSSRVVYPGMYEVEGIVKMGGRIQPSGPPPPSPKPIGPPNRIIRETIRQGKFIEINTKYEKENIHHYIGGNNYKSGCWY